MNPFYRNFRQHFYGNSINQGFTLIELLVVIMIIGILSAIALPAFLSQVNKAIESGAIQKVKYYLDRQQEHYNEDNSFSNLGVTVPREDDNYSYQILADNTLFHGAIHVALSKKPGLKSFMTVIYLQNGEIKTCSPVEIDLKAPIDQFQVMKLLLQVKSNPAKYCP
jgi:type IV pilus assembly protein PilA